MYWSVRVAFDPTSSKVSRYAKLVLKKPSYSIYELHSISLEGDLPDLLTIQHEPTTTARHMRRSPRLL
eukprot:SAG31_NODE_22853_length_516_cov_1.501199_1_plen_68_part_00